jgi:hypothetical protein
MSYDVNKLTKLGHLKSLATNLKAAIPTKVSQLTNDAQYQTNAQVAQAIQTAIAATGHAHFEKVDAVPEAASAQDNVLYLVLNEETQHYDIYAKVEGEVVLLDDTTVDLSNYVQKDGDKVLSDNNFSDADKTKLDGIAEGANNYTHPSHTAAASGFYKVTVDELGHVTAVTAVTKEDITGLGIPGQDTTYQKATAEADGLVSKEHFSKVEGVAAGATKVEASTTVGNIKINGTETPVVTIATDGEVAEMLAEVFPTT